MCRGEVRSLQLPMELAWGEQPPQPLPANSSVHYKVTTLKAAIMRPILHKPDSRFGDGGNADNDNSKEKTDLT